MSPSDRAGPLVLIALALVVLLACGTAASTWKVFGNTWDEPEHLAAGLELLDQGHYTYDIQHPPLARLMLALGPWLAGARSQNTPPPDGGPEGLKILYNSGHYDLYLNLARAGALPFLALLVLVTYLWGRTVLGPWPSVWAAGITAVTPAVLGHGALATIDVAAASTCLLALWCARRWFLTGTLTDAWSLGLSTSLAMGTKLSALPFGALGGALLLGLQVWEGRRLDATPSDRQAARRWTGVLLILSLIAVILTLAYGGRFIYLTTPAHKFNQALWYLFGKTGLAHDVGYTVFSWFKVPEAFQWYLGGIEAVSVHNSNGHLSYLLGQNGTTGWWYFYIVALAVKTPLPMLCTGLIGLCGLTLQGLRERCAVKVTPGALFVVLLGFVSLFSHINIGIRHVLILYPLLAIGSVTLLMACFRWVEGITAGVARRVAFVALCVVCAMPLIRMVTAWPDYLAYFNVLAPDPEAVLVDSDLDWGQDLKRLALRLHELKVPEIALAYSGSAILAKEEGLPPFTVLGPDQRATGWVAVSALARVHAPERFAWLDRYPRYEKIGKTIDLYRVPAPSPQAGAEIPTPRDR